MNKLILFLLSFFYIILSSAHAELHSGEISVAFNHDLNFDYTDPYRLITRKGDNFEEIIIREINSATSSIDLAVQEIKLPLIAKALALKQKQGIKIRIVLENTYSRAWSTLTPAEIEKMNSYERARYNEFVRLLDTNHDGIISQDEANDRDALIILKNAGIQFIDDTADGSKGSGLMHHKFMVIDGIKTLITSANFTLSDIHGDFKELWTRGNSNALVVISNTVLSQKFEYEFSEFWNYHHFGLKKLHRNLIEVTSKDPELSYEIIFSPTSKTLPYENSTNGVISNFLKAAKKSIHAALFVFSEQELANAMRPASQRGAEIKFLIEHNFAYRYYSELLDLLGVQMLSPKCFYEPANNPWQSPNINSGVPILPIGDMLHHKFAVIDGNKVLFGSHNWSASANRENDETFLVIHNKEIAAAFDEEFFRLYKNSNLGITPYLKDKISAQEILCKPKP